MRDNIFFRVRRDLYKFSRRSQRRQRLKSGLWHDFSPTILRRARIICVVMVNLE
jgi:hypothetical protein